MRSITKITLDTVLDNAVTIAAKQGDAHSRFIIAKITDNGEDSPAPSGASVRFNAYRMCDGMSAAFSNPTTGRVLQDGTIEVEIDSWVLEKQGTVNCSISITSDGGRLITTRRFSIYVEDWDFEGAAISETTPPDLFDTLVGDVASQKSTYGFITLNQNAFENVQGVYRATIAMRGVSAGDLVLFYPSDENSRTYIRNGGLYFKENITPPSDKSEITTAYLCASSLPSNGGNVVFAYRVLRGGTFETNAEPVEYAYFNFLGAASGGDESSGNKGWTQEQVELLSDVSSILRQVIDLLIYEGPTTSGREKAGNMCDKLDELVNSLREHQPSENSYEVQSDGSIRFMSIPAGSYTITNDGSLKVL